jgi:predicted ATPase/class 3 adenylate cyclase/DNA-binding CsgD family transcriptional regulator
MVASMSGSDPRADATLVNWSDLAMSGLLPTGTVTLLLADVEGSTRLWETQAEEMTAAFAALDRTLSDVVAAHGGVRPVEQGEGDSFVVAFARASGAVACALALQRAPLAPIRLRIGVHTGEVQLRDDANYIGPAINRAARLRDLAHGGQTVLSGTTEALVADTLPLDAWLTDLGMHELRDVPRPERVVQLCHPELQNDFPPLRTPKSVDVHDLPAQLTSFIGRGAQIENVATLLNDNRIVTLTGAGGCGKTRLAAQIATRLASTFPEGVWWLDLAPIAHSAVLPVAFARALGLPDQQARSTMDTLVGFVGHRRMLIVLDNCEHLLEASASLVAELLAACPVLKLLTTSREPIGVPGEVTFVVPSLSLADEAIELFADRARRVRPDFGVTDDNAAAVTEICRRLDGMPLAIELAAARVRALSLDEIVGGLHDRFRLLTGGARTAVRRQQTLHASVDWSHALLTEPERVLFRRLAAFAGGFDLDAAHAVAGSANVARYQLLDQLALLVDKSLVVAESSSGPTRYRLLETVRQYALEKLGESGEADDVRSRHRDYYTSMAAELDGPSRGGHDMRVAQAEAEIDNLRAAFAWSCESSNFDRALQLASSLQPLWLNAGRFQEGMGWFDAVLADGDGQSVELPAAVHARALADRAMLDVLRSGHDRMVDQARHALAIARELDDPALIVRALIACGSSALYGFDAAQPYLAEAIGLARELGDRWGLCQALAWLSAAAAILGDPVTAITAAREGRDLAAAIGEHFVLRQCRWALGVALLMLGNLAEAIEEMPEVIAEAEAAHDFVYSTVGLFNLAQALAYHGDTGAAEAAARKALQSASDNLSDPFLEGFSYAFLALAAVAAGDGVGAADASEAASTRLSLHPQTAPIYSWVFAHSALAGGDLVGARRWADAGVTVLRGWHLMLTLIARARVAMAQGEPEQAESDAYDALACAADTGAHLGVSDVLEILANLACSKDRHADGARLFGAAQATRERTGEVRMKIYDAEHETAVAAARDTLGESDFDAAWADGGALSTEEAIAYAQRGRGERKRPSSGWGSLTPTELDVVRLVSEGLTNKDIAARLFVSPRTVETHLTHVYAKLGVASRVQLAQEVARHT